MSRLVVFDFEVFKHDTLLGALLIDDKEVRLFQSWNLEEIKAFYEDNVSSIWIGHNNARYDNFILQAVVNGRNEEQIKLINDSIIIRQVKYKLQIPLMYYDLMNSHTYSLKVMEAFMGKDISESEVDFNIDRKLTDEEKKLTESYNRDDLDQTYDDLKLLHGEFTLRLDIINEFKLPMTCLNVTGTQLAEEVLHAEKIDGIEKQVRKPEMWPTLRLKNQQLIDYYMNHDWEKKDESGKVIKKTLDLTLCGTPHKIAAGGIHGAQKNYHADWAYYFDVSGYYNLIMIRLGLLPRSIPPEYRQFYEDMYHTQLKLKKTNPQKRPAYKTILLSVFGAMNNQYCKFYDPHQGDLVRLSGQLYIVDLLEKLEGKILVVQSNTDGVIAVPINNAKEEDIIKIIDEWQERTGFVLKLEKIYDIYQRDVNNYMYRDASGEIHVVGEAVTHYAKIDSPFWKNSYNSKEPLIICTSIVEYFMNGVLPEDTIRKYSRTLRMFQQICRPLSFDYLEYESIDKSTGEVSTSKLQNVNRVFAYKNDDISGMVYKRKFDGKKAKVSNLPDSVFVYNKEILSDDAIDKLQDKIDWNYYIKRAYERISEFKDIPQAKCINYIKEN